MPGFKLSDLMKKIKGIEEQPSNVVQLPVTTTAPSNEVRQPIEEIPNGAKILEIFHNAQKHLKYPKINYNFNDPEDRISTIRFYLASSGSRYAGGIHITDGRSFENNTYYGVIDKNGVLNLRHTVDELTADRIKFILKDPITAASVSGIAFDSCCFCGHELTHPNSLFYGYGPICASNWGLPWQDAPIDTYGLIAKIEEKE